MPSIWIEAQFVKLGDLLVVDGLGTSDVVHVAQFVGYTWITNAEGNTFVYPSAEVINVVCEYDYMDYDNVEAEYWNEEYDRQEREWLEDDRRYHEERMLFLQTSHIAPAIMDGWYSG